MENSGLKLSCLYALPPHKKGYCGPKENKKSSLIVDFVEKGRGDMDKIKEIFVNDFPVLASYYKIIAQKNNLDLFNKEVIRAYWTGNNLLDSFFDKGKFIPFHLAHVLTSKKGMDFANNCFVNWGMTTRKKEKIFFTGYQLERSGKKIVLDFPFFGKILNEFIPDLETDNNISVHWGKAIEILNQEKARNLEKYTRLTLDFFNQN